MMKVTNLHSWIKTNIVLVSLSLIAITGFMVYVNSLQGEFLVDDEYLVKNDERIRSWTYLPKIFNADLRKGVVKKHKFYRPIRRHR